MKRNIMRINLYPFVYIVGLFFFTSCGKPNVYSNAYNIEVVREWKLQLLSVNELHDTPEDPDSSVLYIHLNSDNSIRFDVFIDSFQYMNDAITSVDVKLGDPVTDGPLIASLPARISPGGVTGILYNVRQSFIDTLVNDNIEKYINLPTRKAPEGLVRAQLNTQIIYAANVALTGSENVPSVSTATTGTAFIRITDNHIMYSKVVINNDEPTDPITTAGIYRGTTGATGALFRPLVSNPAEFNKNIKTTLAPADTTFLLNNSTYIAAGSATYPNGKIRGQFRK